MSELMYFDELLVLAGLEGTYGVDGGLTASANAVQTKNATIRPAQGQKISRDVDSSTWGNDLNYLVGKYCIIEFDVEVSGSGAAGNEPGISPLLEMAAHSKTVVAATSAAYAPIQDALKSGSIYFYMGEMIWKGLGGRANVSLKYDKNGFGYFHFTIWTLFTLPTNNASIPAPTYINFNEPYPLSADNTPIVTLHGYPCELHGFQFDVGNKLSMIDVPGAKEVRISDRNSTCSVTIKAPRLPTKDLFAIASNRTLGGFQIEHGPIAGHKLDFSATDVQIEQEGLEPVDAGDGVMGLKCTLNIIGSHTFTWL